MHLSPRNEGCRSSQQGIGRGMTTFDKREEGFEKKFALDEEQKFKAEARRNKLLGLWAAEQLGMSGDAATAYAREVVAADFATRNVAITEQAIRAKMSELIAVAVAEVKAGK